MGLSSIRPTLAVNVPKCVEELREVLSASNSRESDIAGLFARFASGLYLGRPLGMTTIVLMGHTGAGKSRTVNKFIGRNILATSRANLSSTTKVIQRVTVPAVENGISLDLAFDDTPGSEDTTFADRETNSRLFRKYCQTYFSAALRCREAWLFEELAREYKQDISSSAFRSRAYPNAILVFSSWGAVKRDAHNDVENFTSPLGRSLRTLASSDLYDAERPNVVVVVTHALVQYDAECQDSSKEEAEERWKEVALAKETIIQDIAIKLFGPGQSLPVAFVENGK